MKAKLLLFFLIFYACVYGQDIYSIKDIKGMWLSYQYYIDETDSYEPIAPENVFCFFFGESKAKTNPKRNVGFFRKIATGEAPKLMYYSFENNVISLYDRSDRPLSYSVDVESVFPGVSMIATLTMKTDTCNITSKTFFLYREREKEK